MQAGEPAPCVVNSDGECVLDNIIGRGLPAGHDQAVVFAPQFAKSSEIRYSAAGIDNTGGIVKFDLRFTVPGDHAIAIQIAAEDPNFINPHTSLVDSIFRVFLANGNLAMSPRELAEETERSAATILKTLSGGQVYKGIRPAS